MSGVAAVGGLSTAPAAGYLPQTGAAAASGSPGMAASLRGGGAHGLQGAGMSHLAQSLGQLGIQGAVGQQVLSLAANFQETPKSDLLGALVIALLLSRSNDHDKKSDPASLFMAMALMGAMQSNGMQSNGMSAGLSITNHVGGIAGATAAYAAGSGAAPTGQGFSAVG